jgi:hypothetical protein
MDSLSNRNISQDEADGDSDVGSINSMAWRNVIKYYVRRRYKRAIDPTDRVPDCIENCI